MTAGACVGEVNNRAGAGGSGGGGNIHPNTPPHTGSAGGGGPMTPSGPPLPGLEATGAPARTGVCKDIDPGPAPLRRLTRLEYDNTVQDLLGDDRQLGRKFPIEEIQLGFDNSAEARTVSDLLAESYVSAAEQLAKAAVAKLPTLLACDPAKKGEPACLDELLDGFGKRAWRRPLTDAEKNNLRESFREGRTSSFVDGVEAMVQVMLLSPQFLYRVERGIPAGNGMVRLSPHEVASRLSYLVFGSMPDQTLMQAADSGALATRAQIAAQARRMLGDRRAEAMIQGFSAQWLQLGEIDELDKDDKAFPKFKPEQRALFRQETETLIHSIVTGDGKWPTLLTAPYSFVNGPLAQLYGISGVTGVTFTKVDLDPKQRIGILTHAGFLASHAPSDEGLSAPIFRGVFVRERFLCQELPPPPPGASDENPPVTATTTARQSSEARRMKATCGACHRLTDLIGLGFENYDNLGVWRTTDRGGKAVDASGEIVNADVMGTFTGVPELARKLAGSAQVSSCMVRQWFRFAYGRGETDRDACSLDVLDQAFAASGGDVRELLVSLTQTDAFVYLGKGDQP